MRTYIEDVIEAVFQFSDSVKYTFRWTEKMPNLPGFSALILRCDHEYYKIECFVRESEGYVALRLSLPMVYEFEQLDYISGYLECVNKSQKIKSEFALGSWQKIIVRRSIGYEDRVLTAEDLERALAEMIVDAELYLPVIEAIALDNPIPSKPVEPSYLFLFVIHTFFLQELPCDIKEPSRLFFEEYMTSQAFAEA